MSYDDNLYSNLFYPHVSVFCKLLTDSKCCFCCRSTTGEKTAVCHHAAYRISTDVLVRDYEFQMLGVLLFHLCGKCHNLLHSTKYWYAPMGCKKIDQHNTIEAAKRMSSNWNKLVRHYKYKRNQSDYFWLTSW